MCTTDGALLPCKAHGPVATWGDVPLLAFSGGGDRLDILQFRASASKTLEELNMPAREAYKWDLQKRKEG